MRILLLEDDPLQLGRAQAWLKARGHNVVGVVSGAGALKAIERESFDLAILDWMVPDLSGHQILEWVRKREKALPVMFATACDEEDEIASMLEAGADDYVVKPLREREFLARVEALGRRSGTLPDKDRPFAIGPYRLDPRSRCVFLDGKRVDMTPRMAELAIALFRRPGRVLSRAQLYEELWGRRETIESRSLDTHVCRLRQTLALDGGRGVRLSSVYQQGYRLDVIEQASAA